MKTNNKLDQCARSRWLRDMLPPWLANKLALMTAALALANAPVIAQDGYFDIRGPAFPPNPPPLNPGDGWVEYSYWYQSKGDCVKPLADWTSVDLKTGTYERIDRYNTLGLLTSSVERWNYYYRMHAAIVDCAPDDGNTPDTISIASGPLAATGTHFIPDSSFFSFVDIIPSVAPVNYSVYQYPATTVPIAGGSYQTAKVQWTYDNLIHCIPGPNIDEDAAGRGVHYSLDVSYSGTPPDVSGAQLDPTYVHFPFGPGSAPNVIAVPKVSAGSNHDLALRADGTVWAWGRNNYGQLGDGTTTQKHYAMQVPGLSNIVDIAAGYYHSTAVDRQGRVYTWGRNHKGQLGKGDTVDSLTPVQLSGISDAYAVSCGEIGDFTTVVCNDGSVLSWGDNYYGVLADGTTYTDSTVPVAATGLPPIARIAAGSSHMVAIGVDGSVWAWGGNGQGQLAQGYTSLRSNVPLSVTLPSTFSPESVDSGRLYTLISGFDSSLGATKIMGWGYKEYYRFGDYSSSGYYATPITIPGIGSQIVGVSASYATSMAVTAEGGVYTFGLNGSGQCGQGTSGTAITYPNLLKANASTYHLDFMQYENGHSQSLGWKRNGTVWTCGHGSYGQLGDLVTPYNGYKKTYPVQAKYLSGTPFNLVW